MRSLVLLASLLLVPAGAVVMEWLYEWRQKPAMESQLRAWLQQENLQSVTVSLDHFDATLTGVCVDPEAREKAERIVRRLPVIRMRDGENRVEVPARLVRVQAAGNDHELHIGGWVDSPRSRQEVLEIVKRFRPDLTPTAEDLRMSPHVVMGDPVTVAAGTMPSAVADFLETIRAPSSLSIVWEDGFLRMSGHLPSADLRARVIAAVQARPMEWPVEASRLHANEHVAPAPFTKAEPLSAFLRDFYNSPDAGSFVITERQGPKLKAYATPAMVTRWLALLHPVTGAARVPLDDIKQVPSVYHFPGYKPQSTLAPGSLDAPTLRRMLSAVTLYFDAGSSTLKPEQAVKLGPLIYAINQAGSEARIIVGGFADIGGEANATKNVIGMLRATTVKKQLMRMGIRAEVLEVETFDAVKPQGVITDELRTDSRRVEFLLK